MIFFFFKYSFIALLGFWGLAHSQVFKGYTPLRTGTAFAVTERGAFLTSFHLIKGANKVILVDSTRTLEIPVQVTAIDEKTDLALLKAITHIHTQALPILEFSTVLNGLEVFTLGYPFPTVQGNSLKITSGIITSLEGYKGNQAHFQFSAPIQNGNSGGPVLSVDGAVVGIIQGKLEKANTLMNGPVQFQALQSVNIALNARRIEEFLVGLGVTYQKRGLQIENAMRPHAIYSKLASGVFMLAVVETDTDSGSAGMDAKFADLLKTLIPTEKAALLAAYEEGYKSSYSFQDGVLLIKALAVEGDTPNRLYKILLTYKTNRKHEKDFYFKSVEVLVQYNCLSNKYMIFEKEYREGSFGIGNSLLKLVRRVDTDQEFKELSSLNLKRIMNCKIVN
jgi:hypothetical protein